MDVREKLVELSDIQVLQREIECVKRKSSTNCTDCLNCDLLMPDERILTAYKNAIDALQNEQGVTVREWISVKEHLPQENEPEGTLCETVQVLLNNGKVSVGWCNRSTKLWYHMDYYKDYYTSNDYDHTPVIAWQPLAQPPKGE